MDKIKKARDLFLQLESRDKGGCETARRNFEIQSRIAQARRVQWN
jgi:hypothetical protein